MKPTTIALTVLFGVALTSVGQAQLVSSLSPQATQADVASAVAAATPPPCPAPLGDTLTGSAGSQPLCMSRQDSSRPTQVQSTRTTSASDGSFSVTWPVAFPSAPTYGHAEILGGTQPYSCDVVTMTATGATGKCYALASTTLPGTLGALSGLVISPVANPGAGLTVMMVGRQ